MDDKNIIVDEDGNLDPAECAYGYTNIEEIKEAMLFDDNDRCEHCQHGIEDESCKFVCELVKDINEDEDY